MNMKSPHVIWAAVIIVAIIVSGTVVLALNGKDVEVVKDTIINAAIPLLALFGLSLYQKMGKVEDTTNGNNTRLMDTIREKDQEIARLAEQNKELALRVLPILPPEEV